jgi:exopolysaccharide production protein ExoZ
MILRIMDRPTSDGAEIPVNSPAAANSASDQRPQSVPPAVAPDSELAGTIRSIQVLRFIAAFCVVVFHAHIALMLNFPGHVPDGTDHAFRVGASGVHIFFVISGFVMVYTSWRSRLTPGSFLKRRLVRIYPIYWLVGATYLLLHQLLGTAYHLAPQELAGAALLLPHTSSLVIGPGWTLSFEMYFYLCFALALFAGVRWGLALLSVFYLLSVCAGFALAPQAAWAKLASNSLLLEFMMGAWLGYAFSRGLVVPRRLGGLLVAVAIALFVSGFWLDYDRLPSVLSWGIPSLLLVTGALAFEPELRGAPGRFFAKLGDSSYLLYLSHVLLIDLFIATPISALNRSPATAVAISFPLALLCTAIAALGYEWIELPLLKAVKHAILSPSKRPGRVSIATP